jgi:hypothetical protein
LKIRQVIFVVILLIIPEEISHLGVDSLTHLIKIYNRH